MNVLIVGGSRTGSRLAQILLENNHHVHLIEHRAEVLAKLHKELPTDVIHEGGFLDMDVLERAGIRQANIVAAVTSCDEENLVICKMARQIYNAPRTIARVEHPSLSWLFDEKFDVDIAVNQTELMAHLIEQQMSIGDMKTLLKLHTGDYSLFDQKIEPGCKLIGQQIKDMILPDHCVLAAIIRSGELIVPRGVTELEAGDEVLAVTDSEGARQLAELLSADE